MKTSRRLLFGTFLTLLFAPVVLVAFSRATSGMREVPPPQRTAAAELATLRDFTAIEIRSDASFEIFSAPDYSIAYDPLFDIRGNFTASVRDGTLFIEGYGNRANPDPGLNPGTALTASSVRIGLPVLESVDTESQRTLTIRNFEGDTLDVRVGFGEFGPVVLENNRLATLLLRLGPTQSVELRGNTIDNSVISHFGLTITTD